MFILRQVNSPEFKALNVDLALDEGLANPDNAYTVFYGERCPWWFMVKAEGPTGHGSRFIQNTAPSKILHVANKAMEFRKEQEDKLGHVGGCAHAQAKKLGDVTTMNLTMLRAGVTVDNGHTFSLNCIPTVAEAGFDMRITPNTPIDQVTAMLDGWVKEAATPDGPVTWNYAPWTLPLEKHYASSTDPEENPWWGVMINELSVGGRKVEPEIFPAATDSRFIRELGLPAFGFSPMANTPVLLHEHDEYIDEGVFLEGIDVYQRLIPALADADIGNKKQRKA